ncbi:MAG: AAA family ATPase [Endomicrobiia bacterium]|nr:AAA family ATPase [Endomicrobiia bacterium]
MLIGITGFYCSGKDTAAEFLVGKKGFAHYSLSDVLRDELKRRGKEITRANLLETGVDLRTKRGFGVLAELAVEKCRKTPGRENFAITSIRHPDEIRRLAAESDFFLLNLTAPPEIRFERLKNRGREQDPRTFEEFTAFEQKESATEGPGQQLGICAAMADFTVDNSLNDYKTLYEKLSALVEQLRARMEEARAEM